MATSEQTRPPGTTSPPPRREQVAQQPNMLATIAFTVGVVAFGLYALDLHSHRCEGEGCGHKWYHLGAFNVGDPASHTCARCGSVQWFKDGVPHVFREALRRPPPKVLPDSIATRLGEIREGSRRALSSGTAMFWPREGSR